MHKYRLYATIIIFSGTALFIAVIAWDKCDFGVIRSAKQYIGFSVGESRADALKNALRVTGGVCNRELSLEEKSAFEREVASTGFPSPTKYCGPKYNEWVFDRSSTCAIVVPCYEVSYVFFVDHAVSRIIYARQLGPII